MAVKPITNKQVVASSQINRGKQTSTKDIKDNSSNRKQSFTPGINLSDNYAITLKNVDTAIIGHVKNVIRPKVKEANEEVENGIYDPMLEVAKHILNNYKIERR